MLLLPPCPGPSLRHSPQSWMCSGPFLFPILEPSPPPSSRQCPKAPEGMARERKAPRSRRERTPFSPEMRWPSGQLPFFIPSSFQGGSWVSTVRTQVSPLEPQFLTLCSDTVESGLLRLRWRWIAGTPCSCSFFSRLASRCSRPTRDWKLLGRAVPHLENGREEAGIWLKMTEKSGKVHGTEIVGSRCHFSALYPSTLESHYVTGAVGVFESHAVPWAKISRGRGDNYEFSGLQRSSLSAECSVGFVLLCSR